MPHPGAQRTFARRALPLDPTKGFALGTHDYSVDLGQGGGGQGGGRTSACMPRNGGHIEGRNCPPGGDPAVARPVRPGQFVNVGLRLELHRDALTVPSVAVQRSKSALYAFVLRPGATVSVQPAEIGQDDGRTAEITGGLDDGASVAVNGMSRLQDGASAAVTLSGPAG